jgi:hypothetical protein
VRDQDNSSLPSFAIFASLSDEGAGGLDFKYSWITPEPWRLRVYAPLRVEAITMMLVLSVQCVSVARIEFSPGATPIPCLK